MNFLTFSSFHKSNYLEFFKALIHALAFSLRFFYSFYFFLFVVPNNSFAQRIAFIIATEKEERYKRDKKFFIDEGKKLGIEIFFGSSDNNQEKQNELVSKAVKEGVKAIVIQPVDSFQAKKAVEIAKAQKIPVVAYDRIIYDADVDYYVTHDSIMVGIVQARECVNFFKDEKRVVVISGGKNHSVAKQITTGNLMILEKHPNVKILGIYYHEGWDEKESYTTLKNLLKTEKNISCVLANNSSLARGSIRALEEEGIDTKKIFVAGADADLPNIKLLLQEKQKLEILKDIEPLARTAVRVAYEIINGKQPSFQTTLNNGKVDVKVINIPVEVIKKDNIDILIKKGFHKKEDIYN
ncbi:MAG: substrate-binding domain-containing protein [Candidatus Calescibacterium sp.]|nr:substrate-binding domain-containing protein [Candidatus Calescibacterium sp.]MDW8086768.1 substrate-binding domain-containing protein [Candidatus Calescibacterium sp.]